MLRGRPFPGFPGGGVDRGQRGAEVPRTGSVRPVSDSVAVVWDEALLGYTMGGDHPLHPVRLDLTMRLADSLGVLAARRLRGAVPPRAG